LSELDSLQQKLGVSFEDDALLRQALVHSSCLNEIPEPQSSSNDRLEFLGDALLYLVTAEELYHRLPDFQEGELTVYRSALVRTDTLARVARSMDLGDHLHLGRGEEETGGRHRERNLAGVVEAIIGAVLIDQGFEAAREFTLRLLKSEFEFLWQKGPEVDHKSRLQQLMQARGHLSPDYRTVDSRGPDHDREFTVEVFDGDILLGTGTGPSKQRAEQRAAHSALDKIEGDSVK